MQNNNHDVIRNCLDSLYKIIDEYYHQGIIQGIEYYFEDTSNIEKRLYDYENPLDQYFGRYIKSLEQFFENLQEDDVVNFILEQISVI